MRSALRPSRIAGCTALLFASAGLISVGCGDSGSPAATPEAGAGAGAGAANDGGSGGGGGGTASETLEVEVIAAEGAEIELPGGAALIIPEDSLGADTTITIRVPAGQDRQARVQMFELGPAGTVFDPPATLRVPYVDVDGADPLIRGLHFSDENPLEEQVSEQTRAQELVALAQDQDENTVDFQVDHFTFFWVFAAVDDYAYVVPHIPGRYLLPGDLVFTLTKAEGYQPAWRPGHVGVFAASTETCAERAEAGGGGDRVIEATPPKVQRSTLRGLQSEIGHIYMGARRPGTEGSEEAKAPLTASERTSLVTFLNEQIGDEYSMVFGSGNVGSDQWSCVGLAEAAYDSIDRGSLNGLREGSISTPIELYWNTHPVDSIDVRVGGEVRIDFHGVVVHPDSPSVGTALRGGYCDDFPCVGTGDTNDISMQLTTALPPGAEFTEQSGRRYVFAWTPQPENADQSFEVEVRMRTSPRVAGPLDSVPLGDLSRTAKVTLNVVPCETPVTPSCASLPPESEPAQAFLNDLGVFGRCEGLNTALALSVLLSSGDQEKEPANDFTTVAYLMAMAALLEQDPLDAAFNQSIYECGAGASGYTLCPPGKPTLNAGEYYVLFSVLAGDVPLAAPDDHFQYAFVFDQDGDTTNNFAASASYPADFFDGTDRWYQALYTPAGGWKLQVNDATNGVVTTIASNARIVIKDNVIALLVPKGELSIDNPAYRVTAFRHKGDYGMNLPYDWDGFVEPPVADGLHDEYAP